MFINCYYFIVFYFPASHAATSALSAIPAANFPLIGDFIALEYNLTYWEPVRVLTLPRPPVTKNYF